MDKINNTNHQLSGIFLGSILAANPFIMFLLFNNFFLSLIPLIIVFTSLYYLNRYFNKAKWAFIYLVNFYIIISIFIHFEVVFKYGFSDYLIEDLYVPKSKYYFNKSNLEKVLDTNNFKTIYKTNKQGFRIPESISKDTVIQECDWLFLGDSYTQGAQVDFKNLFTSTLFNYYPNKIILNLGMSGFGIAEEYYLFKDVSEKLKPKKVFLQLCSFNDFMNVDIKSIGLTDYLMHFSDFSRFLLFNLKFKNPDQLPLGRWTEPFYPTEQENINYNIFYKKFSKKKKYDIEKFEYYLKLFNKEVKKIGAELIILLIPTKEQIYYRYFEEVVNSFDLDVKYLDMKFPNNLLSKLAASLDLKLIDLTYEYPKYPGEVFFENDEHLNVYGHSVTADIISNLIASNNQNNELKLLNTYTTGDRYPSYAFNGESILFQSILDGNYEIMIADSHFNEIKRLTNNSIDDIHPSLSPNGDKFVLTVGDQASMRTKIFLVNLEKKIRKIVTKRNNQFGSIPSFSPDGKLITYAQWYFNSDKNIFTKPQIVICDLKGENETIVTKGNYENWRPIFSKDLKSIYYISRKDKNYDIYVFNQSIQKEFQLTNTPYDEWDPKLSPDGKKLIYAAKKNGNWDLFIMNIDGSGVTQITNTKGDEWDPCFHPLGEKILFGGEFGFFNGIFEYKISKDN